MSSSAPPVFGVPTFCIITGASRGIGRQLAVSLSSHFGKNSLTVLTARSEDDLQDTRKQLIDCCPGLAVKLVKGDLGDENEARNTIAGLFEGVHTSQFEHAMVIHNAGTLGDMSYIRDLSSTDLGLMQKHSLINVNSTILLTGMFLKMFLKRDGLRRTVVNISSLLAIEPKKSMSLYCGVKAARDMIMKTLALEDPDIRVLSYAPGIVKTAMSKEIVENAGDREMGEHFGKLTKTALGLTPAATCNTLIKILSADTFQSASHIDVWDVEPMPVIPKKL